jgi:hypothetical protein
MILGSIFVWNIGSVLVLPSNHPIGNPPPNLYVENVEFSSASGATIHGWFIAGQPGKGVVILMHGVHADRQTMVARAEFLREPAIRFCCLIFKDTAKASGKISRSGFWKAETRPPPLISSSKDCPAKRLRS